MNKAAQEEGPEGHHAGEQYLTFKPQTFTYHDPVLRPGVLLTLSPKSLGLRVVEVGLERKPSHWFWGQNSNTQFKPALKSLDLTWWLVISLDRSVCDLRQEGWHPFLSRDGGMVVWIDTELDCQNAIYICYTYICLYCKGNKRIFGPQNGQKARAPHFMRV